MAQTTLVDTMEFGIALRMRDFAGLQARVANGEIISRAELENAYLPLQADYDAIVAWLEGEGIKQLVDGAAYLFSNDYEAGLIEHKTGWSHDEVLERVGVRVTTLGKDGARVEEKGKPTIEIACPPEELKADPTGVGDAFRAGFLAGLSWQLSHERCAQIGSLVATYVIETVGTQEYDLAQTHFLSRFEQTYGTEARVEIEAHVRCPRP